MIHLSRSTNNLNFETFLLTIIHGVSSIRHNKYININVCDSKFDNYVNLNLPIQSIHIIVRFIVLLIEHTVKHPHVDVVEYILVIKL